MDGEVCNMRVHQNEGTSSNLNPLAKLFVPLAERPYLLNPYANCFIPNVPYIITAKLPSDYDFTNEEESFDFDNTSGTNVLDNLLELDCTSSAFFLDTPNETQEVSDIDGNWSDFSPNLDSTPCVFDQNTPPMDDDQYFSFEEAASFNNNPASNFSFEMYMLLVFCIILSLFVMLYLFYNPESTNDISPQNLLQSLRLKNLEKIIFGHLNINSIRNKIGLLEDMVKERIDILLVSETKDDASFPIVQLQMNGYSVPYRLDRDVHGGGILLYVRKDISTKPLPLISQGIECIIIEITISKKQWLLFGIYNPQVAATASFLSILNDNLGHYLPSYDNVILFGDFNSEMSEKPMENFCMLYGLKSLNKVPNMFQK